MKIEIDTRALQVMAEPGIGWIRVFGRGFTWKDTRRHPLVFSERNGYRRHLEIGPWSFRWLGKKSPFTLTALDPQAFRVGDLVEVHGARDSRHNRLRQIVSVSPNGVEVDAVPESSAKRGGGGPRALKIDPRTFYWWATLALGVELLVALGCRAWLLAVAVWVIDGAAHWRRRWWSRRISVIPYRPVALDDPWAEWQAHLHGQLGIPADSMQAETAKSDFERWLVADRLSNTPETPGLFLHGTGVAPAEEPPELRRVHGRCMGCQQEIFFDPAAQNAGVCEACAGGSA